MIIFFALIGLLLVGGGGWAIFDGLPYLVLERGFTQVIVGTVMACAGVVLLALSRVLAELKRVRTTMSNAMMAVSMATLAGEGDGAPMAGSFAEAAVPVSGVALAGEPLAPVAAGAFAGTLLATAGTDAARQGQDNAGEPGEETGRVTTDTSAIEPDLFAAPPGLDGAGEAGGTRDAPDDTAPSAIEPTEFDAVDEDASAANRDENIRAAQAIEPSFQLEHGDIAASPDANDPLARAVSDALALETERDVALARASDLDVASDPFVTGGRDPFGRIEPRLDWPSPEPEPDRFEAVLPGAAASSDEFGNLREALSGHIDDRLAEAETLTEPSGRARWFEPQEAPSTEDDVASGESVWQEPAAMTPMTPTDLTPPLWPPQTRTPDSDDAAPDLGPAQTGMAAGEHSLDVTAPAFEPQDEVSQPRSGTTDATGEMAAEPASPAASNEGVVGAYQVGDAHFTIFADGSIQARTPDGEYKFGSMDELKTYLASERSRLGA